MKLFEPELNKIQWLFRQEAQSDGKMSEDEEDYQDNDSHDSFIDDRTCPSINTATQSATKIDMMAIYRRSLLTQSPMPGFPSGSTTPSPYSSEAATARTSETGSFSGKQSFSSHTPITRSEKPPIQVNQNSETLHANDNTEDVSSKTEGRKRKLSFFCPSSSVPAINLEQKFQIQCENSVLCDNDDDGLFDDIDFDEVEAQAALLLKQKSVTLTSEKQEVTVPLLPQNLDLDIPSFDLGI